MAAEQMLHANPVDGVVLLGGSGKPIPSLLMAASVDLSHCSPTCSRPAGI